MADKEIYKIIFHNQGKVYQIHAKGICQSSMFGFVEVEGLIFGETSGVLIDPAEEKLKSEFSNVESSFIPAQAIIRIDKVSKEGSNKIMPGIDNDNITPFPAAYSKPQQNSLE